MEPMTSSGLVAALSLAAPWGPVHLAATERGVVALELMTTRDAFDDRIGGRLRTTVLWLDRGTGSEPGPADAGSESAAAATLRSAAVVIAAALGGDIEAMPRLDSLPLDLADRPAWDRAVLAAVRAIPSGEVRSYGDIARAIDRPGAARAVGGAVGRNPVGFLIPCHRVVAGDGTLGGYGGGWWGDHERLLDLKAELLAREGVSLPRSRSPGRRGR